MLEFQPVSDHRGQLVASQKEHSSVIELNSHEAKDTLDHLNKISVGL